MGYFFHNPHLVDRRNSQFCIVIFLPTELNDIIKPIREKYDPSYNEIDPHVTLVFPFETNKPLNEVVSIIQREIDKLSVFDINLSTVEDFYPEFPIIYWLVEQSEELKKLYFEITNSLELTIPHEKYVPHVTVAQEISTHRKMLVKENIIPYLPVESFFAESIDLISPMVDNRWVSVRTFSLK